MKLKCSLFYIVFCLICIIPLSRAQKMYSPSYRNIFILLEDKKIESRISTDKKTKINSELIYYWYDNNLIHKSQGNYSKYLVDGKYIEYYLPSNNLQVKGFFKKGLKHGHWFEWYSDGMLKTKAKWYKGQLNGKAYYYDPKGEVTKIEKYCDGRLNGKSLDIDSGIVTKNIYKEGKKVERSGLFVKSASSQDSTKANDHNRIFSSFFNFFRKK